MGKKKRSHKETAEKIALMTSTINLLIAVITLITRLME